MVGDEGDGGARRGSTRGSTNHPSAIQQPTYLSTTGVSLELNSETLSLVAELMLVIDSICSP
jgi:hypothetical protein